MEAVIEKPVRKAKTTKAKATKRAPKPKEANEAVQKPVKMPIKGGGADPNPWIEPKPVDSTVSKRCNEIAAIYWQWKAANRFTQNSEKFLFSTIRSYLGIDQRFKDTEHQDKADEAKMMTAQVIAGEVDPPEEALMRPMIEAIQKEKKIQKIHEKVLAEAVTELPAYEWVKAQRGFGLANFAKIVGECGNLSNYPCPSALWSRMGLKPYTRKKDGMTLAGSTWKNKGGLSAEEWTEYGYSPRRRSVAFMLGESLFKMNFIMPVEGAEDQEKKPGKYRARALEARAIMESRDPEGSAKHHYLHGHLLMTKLAIKDLWIEWNR